MRVRSDEDDTCEGVWEAVWESADGERTLPGVERMPLKRGPDGGREEGGREARVVREYALAVDISAPVPPLPPPPPPPPLLPMCDRERRED